MQDIISKSKARVRGNQYIQDPFNKHLLCHFLPLYYQRPGTCDMENAIVNVEAIGVALFKELKNTCK